ncbi:hypothetical protein BAE44_0005607 [Dichanthelium oligosanthes]|uniref:Uncharacterized protein n=1 Tax=Dichanthelium oligosanthes TaxID=888268 RepID=A0A1E5W7L7_9POAL|nr:hypothetical protein BAE44_0005607 [Dichanthelium oligosanthes]
MLHVGAARVTVTTLPASFPRSVVRNAWDPRHIKYSYLLATTSVGGSPIVLVADDERISAWPQSKHTKKWKQRPWVVIEKEEILRFNNVGEVLAGKSPGTVQRVELKCFAERSGAVLIRIKCVFFWLDLQTMKIVRHFSDPRVDYEEVYCSIEICSSSWVPTFSTSSSIL